MTDSDEKLIRLFAAEASRPDPAFTLAVEARLRRAMRARLALQGAVAVALTALAGAAAFGWRIAKPVLAELIGPLPGFSADILGAPAPALAVVAVALLWFTLRRHVRVIEG